MITAIVLARNEEKNIERCIKSLQWCNEIIVIDDESSDRTVELASKLGAKVFKRALKDDFAAQRNFALEKAANSWVLFVDADEVVTTELSNEIMEKVKKVEYKGFKVKRIDYLWGKKIRHGDIARFNYVRLGRRGVGKWRRRVDEVWEIEGKIDQLNNPLLHYPHQSVAEFLQEINFKSSLNARQFYEEGKSTNLVDWFKPLATFFRSWIFKLGFLDGMAGFNIALLMSFHSFLVRSKLFLFTKSGGQTLNVKSTGL
ncbi:MAG: glycosyltransferase [Microgenomates group bacterium GW2011_GWA2_44_7]|uniref:Glycosyltransferase n=1 Tax=Candidatus Woesebacteria bacterium GW2011_GWA1_43_12 TaxID=1618557 RepID=A0A0G1CYF1_9BACT|nr:MAG: glycosyltransferase [Candidatus Woesebacteria bacterium GW2011_GWA1_43_12]KKT75870.1 MAG: glycosyltransferase [Microgenomates group bacterium GW2011_GWA2_44_7]KKT78509.1 MAG: glycosyltransferase [Microgenomates group bacterium GW2011_GWB1_44_8]